MQTVQYIQPHHAAQRLGQAELLVIDEAAAIPLPMVKAMLGPYLVFLCSTGAIPLVPVMPTALFPVLPARLRCGNQMLVLVCRRPL